MRTVRHGIIFPSGGICLVSLSARSGTLFILYLWLPWIWILYSKLCLWNCTELQWSVLSPRWRFSLLGYDNLGVLFLLFPLLDSSYATLVCFFVELSFRLSSTRMSNLIPMAVVHVLSTSSPSSVLRANTQIRVFCSLDFLPCFRTHWF